MSGKHRASTWSRVMGFIRRHRLAVVVSAVGLLAVVGVTVIFLSIAHMADEPALSPAVDIADVARLDDRVVSETTASVEPTVAEVPGETREPDMSATEPSAPAVKQTTPPPAKSFHGAAFSGATQVIVVTADTMSTTRATLATYQQTGTTWSKVMSTAACVGKRGMVLDAERVEGQLQTPIGVYSLSYAFGTAANPNTSDSSLSYKRVGSNTYYDGNYGSATFNDLVEGVPTAGDNYEHMYQPTAYKYGIDTGFNLEQKPGKGNAIFIHCNTGSGYTAGCVSISESKMVELLRWLDRGQDPVVLICLTGNLDTFYY
ncbi:MAG: L,D-transpeptidase family protein [Coriobacteriia bacterium]|nr:L,D-transpeptidase family protein [Coriobacteriia bacterium]MBN2822807.1 L,D-transpeptidase family protein [Coriobacteriia bacterium]